MISAKATRHMAQNEMIFREYNERVQRGLNELAQLAHQDGTHHLIPKDDEPLHFYCECSDENCSKRITLQPSVYAAIHEHRLRFVVINGHNVPEIENIVYSLPEYSVVEKKTNLPEGSRDLHATEVDNG